MRGRTMKLLLLLLTLCLLRAEANSVRGPLIVEVIDARSVPGYRWPLGGATVELVGTGRTRQASWAGVVIIDSLTSVNHALRVSKPGWATGAFVVSLTGEGPIIARCSLPPELPRYVAGTVRDSFTGQPITDASVLVFSADENCDLRMGPFVDTTDSAGRYMVLLESIPMHQPPGSFRVLFDHQDYLAMSKWYLTPRPCSTNPDTAFVDEQLARMPRSSIVGRVTDQWGRPVPLLGICGGWGAWTDLDGNYEIHKDPGTGGVSAERSYIGQDPNVVKVPRGRPAELDFSVWIDMVDYAGKAIFYEVDGIAYHDDPRRRYLSSVLPSLHVHRK